MTWEVGNASTRSCLVPFAGKTFSGQLDCCRVSCATWHTASQRTGPDTVVAPCAEEPRQLPILVTTVDIGEHQSDQIELYEGDSPEVHSIGL